MSSTLPYPHSPSYYSNKYAKNIDGSQADSTDDEDTQTHRHKCDHGFKGARNHRNSEKKNKYKTELCKNFSEMGYCPYRYKCQYAHGVQELQGEPQTPSNKCYRTRKCKSFWETGVCNYGQRCQFQHYEVKPETKLFLKVTKEAMFADWECPPVYSRVLGFLSSQNN